jgi:hypothetical protein
VAFRYLLWRKSIRLALAAGIAASRGHVFVTRVDPERRTSIGVVSEAADSAMPAGPFPHPPGTSPVIDESHLSALAIAPRHGIDSVAFTLLAADFLFIGPLDGSTYDSIAIPVLRRQGSRPDLIRQFVANPSSAGLDTYKPSVPWKLATLPDGNVASLTLDAELANSRFQGKFFLSVVDPAKRRACADAEVPAPIDPVPAVAFRETHFWSLFRRCLSQRKCRPSSASTRFVLIDAPGPLTWTLMKPSCGRCIVDWSPPMGPRATDIGEEHVLGVGRDGLDGEHAYLHELRRKPPNK